VTIGPVGGAPSQGVDATGTRHLLGWFPAVAVGFATAVAAVVSTGLLIYSGPGFARSLATVLTVQAAALAVGFSFPHPAPEPLDGVRKRWLLALVVFLIAAVYGTVWVLVPTIGSGRWGQGVGLALLAGLPLYACAGLFGGLALEVTGTEEGGRSRLASQGALGAALGFAAAGAFLPKAPTPSSLLVACLVMLSLGGMVYASVRAERPRRGLVARGCKGPPTVRVEEYAPRGDAPAEWLLMEGDVVRTRSASGGATPPVGGGSLPPWDVDLVTAFRPGEENGAWSFLHIGGGASSAASMARAGAPVVEVTVLERAHCVVDLGRSHFGTGLEEDREGVRVLLGNWEDHLRTLEGGFDLIIVDGRAFEAVGGMSALSREGRRLVLSLLAPGGVAAWGPKAVHHPRDLDPHVWTLERRDRVPTHDEILLVRAAVAPAPWGAPPAK